MKSTGQAPSMKSLSAGRKEYNMGKTGKTLQEYINEDPSLGERLTYEEFKERQGRAGNIDDSIIEEAWKAYQDILNREADDNGSNN